MTGLLLGALCAAIGVGFVAALVAILVVQYRKAEARRHDLVGYAAHREWTYLPDDERLVDRFRGSPFEHGRGRRVTHVLHGTHGGRPVTAYDYSYRTSGGQSSSDTTHRYSVVATALGVGVPSLSVSPQGGLGRLLGTIFGGDVQVGNPAFDDRFRVSADDSRFATDVLHPAMTQLLLQWPDLSWRLSVDSLLVIRSGAHTPAEIDAKLEITELIVAQIPPHVWANLGGGGLAPE